jgi:hypothetical protein
MSRCAWYLYVCHVHAGMVSAVTHTVYQKISKDIKRYQKIHVWHFIDQLNIDVALRSTLVHGLFSHSVWFLDARIRFHLVDIVGGMEATAVKGPCPRHSMHCLQMNPDGPHKLFKRLPGFRLSSCSSFRARSKAKSTVPGPVPVTKVLVAQATAEI